MDNTWISFAEVAKVLKISRPTARKRLQKREIPGLVEHMGMMRVDRETFSLWALTKDR